MFSPLHGNASESGVSPMSGYFFSGNRINPAKAHHTRLRHLQPAVLVLSLPHAPFASIFTSPQGWCAGVVRTLRHHPPAHTHSPHFTGLCWRIHLLSPLPADLFCAASAALLPSAVPRVFFHFADCSNALFLQDLLETLPRRTQLCLVAPSTLPAQHHHMLPMA